MKVQIEIDLREDRIEDVRVHDINKVLPYTYCIKDRTGTVLYLRELEGKEEAA